MKKAKYQPLENTSSPNQDKKDFPGKRRPLNNEASGIPEYKTLNYHLRELKKHGSEDTEHLNILAKVLHDNANTTKSLKQITMNELALSAMLHALKKDNPQMQALADKIEEMSIYLANCSPEYKPSLSFEWNSASKIDEIKIKRLFVSAYIGAYKECNIDELDLHIKKDDGINTNTVAPLQLYFEQQFDAEFAKIMQQEDITQFKINYLTVKLHDHPIAFISSQLNYKSGRVYVRWNTVAPTFQKNGIGKMMLAELARYYDTTGIELYTRIANSQACNFYGKNSLTSTNAYNFEEPIDANNKVKKQDIAPLVLGWLKDANYNKTVYAPADEIVHNKEPYLGFYKSRLNLS